MRQPPTVVRHILAAVVVLALAAGIVIRLTEDRGGTAEGTPTTSAPLTLPGGGRSVLPEHRVVAHYGSPGDDNLGILGIGTPDEAITRLLSSARDYAAPNRKPVMPAMELITTIVSSSPGDDGLHRFTRDDEVIQTYLDAARRANALLILDIQPGRSDFLTEAMALERYLVEPDVGLALDPEWRMGPDELPGKVIGHVDAGELNRTAKWLSDLTVAHDLPDKLLVYHQFTDGMIRRRHGLRAYPRIDAVLNADGFGTSELKVATYTRVTRDRRTFGTGFKLFYVEDTGLMTPAQVLHLRPIPDLVMYE